MFGNGFVWDDPKFIVKNQALRGLWPVARFFQIQGSELSFPFTGDRPVMVFSLALDYALWKLNPFGYHLTNLILHLLCVFGVAWLALWLSRSRGVAFLAGALFALHPGHAEGVIAFAGRSDLLACLFVLVGFWGYVRYLRPEGSQKILYYIGSLASFLLACFSKETGLTILGLLVVYEGFGVRNTRAEILRSKIERLVPFLLVGLLYWVQRAKALGGQTAGSVWWGGSPYKNYLMAFEVYARCLRLMFFPLSLSPFHTVSVPAGFWDGRVLWGMVLLLGSLGVTVWTLRRHFRIGFLASWFLVGLIPISNLIPVPGLLIMAEHRLYLASVGACILGGWGGWVIYREGKGWVKPVWGGFVVLVLVLLGIRTFLWCFPWKSEESIARVIMATAPESPVGFNNLGTYLDKAGRAGEAEALFRQAIGLNPDFAEAHNNLGLELADQGKPDEAAKEYLEAIRLWPGYAEAHNNLGIAFGQQGKLDEAVREYQKAIRLRPDYAEAHNNLGIVLGQQGKLDEAASEYREAIRSDPDLAEPYKNLGILFELQGKLEQAEEEYRRALHLNQSLSEGHYALGMVLSERGKLDQAEAEYREAVRQKPDDAQAYFHLGGVLALQEKPNEAEAALREAIRLDPALFEAHNNLGSSLARQGKLPEAEAEYREAFRLEPDSFKVAINLGNVLAKLGRFQEAEAEYHEAIRLAPDFPGTYYNLGIAYLREGRKPEAVKALRAFLSYGGEPRSETEDLIRKLERK